MHQGLGIPNYPQQIVYHAPFHKSQFPLNFLNKDLEYFIKEIQRVSKKGYIELPTKLEDNLVFENKKEHLWQMDFDDVNHKLLISKKIQFLEPVLTVSTIQKMREYFRSSLILELFWENKIEYEFIEVNQDRKDSLNLITLLRKFISKKLRK